MKHKGKYSWLVLAVFLPVLWLPTIGCEKEYSFEGADTVATIRPPLLPDTTTAGGSVNTNCTLCNANYLVEVNNWTFINDKKQYCGTTTDAGFIGINTTFTFFGPSVCSIDSGIVMTIYLPVKFDENKYNITSNLVAFYYYDHHGTSDLFIRLTPLSFSVNVQSYIHLTKVVTGTFGGSVYKPDGSITQITDGRFKVKL